jgi:hypothetical protein
MIEDLAIKASLYAYYTCDAYTDFHDKYDQLPLQVLRASVVSRQTHILVYSEVTYQIADVEGSSFSGALRIHV